MIFDARKMVLETLDIKFSNNDLRALPSNRFEALKGNRKGEYSISIKCSGGFVSNGIRIILQPIPCCGNTISLKAEIKV